MLLTTAPRHTLKASTACSLAQGVPLIDAFGLLLYSNLTMKLEAKSSNPISQQDSLVPCAHVHHDVHQDTKALNRCTLAACGCFELRQSVRAE